VSAGRPIPTLAWVVAGPFLAAGPQFAAATVLVIGLVAAADPVSLGVLVLSGITALLVALGTRKREGQRTTIESRAQTTAEHAQRLDEMQATITSVTADRAYWEDRAQRAEAMLAAERTEHLSTRTDLHRARRDAVECEARLEVAERARRAAEDRLASLEGDAKGSAS
jgi:septal ring factor EnvC (AmiA/AmiB activator)